MNPSNGRARILVIADHYLPGWRAGGPVRSIANIVEALGDRYEFMIVTQNHDHLQDDAYPGVPPAVWVEVGKASVYYGDTGNLSLRSIARLVHDTAPDLVFSNGLFSVLTLRLLMLRWMRRLGDVPILIAPRGELGVGALRLKRVSKRAYISIGRAIGWFSHVYWQASTPEEAARITHFFKGNVLVASDVPEEPASGPSYSSPKEPGVARFAFTARISPMKNLPFLLRLLSRIRGHVDFDIYGAAEPAEWKQVEPLLKLMPENIDVVYHGAVRPDEIEEALWPAHFLVLPTRGENFGHSVFEALRIGRPVLVSDQAPWRGLEAAGAGWSLPLGREDQWIDVLQKCVDLGDTDYRELVAGAHEYAREWFDREGPAERQAEVFDELLHCGEGTADAAE